MGQVLQLQHYEHEVEVISREEFKACVFVSFLLQERWILEEVFPLALGILRARRGCVVLASAVSERDMQHSASKAAA